MSINARARALNHLYQSHHHLCALSLRRRRARRASKKRLAAWKNIGVEGEKEQKEQASCRHRMSFIMNGRAEQRRARASAFLARGMGASTWRALAVEGARGAGA